MGRGAAAEKAVTVCVSVPVGIYGFIARRAAEECRSIPMQIRKHLLDEYKDKLNHEGHEGREMEGCEAPREGMSNEEFAETAAGSPTKGLALPQTMRQTASA